MKTVQDSLYLHVHRGNDKKWIPGAEFFFGRSLNRWVGSFDTVPERVKDSGSAQEFDAYEVLTHAHSVLTGHAQKDPRLEPFYHFEGVKCLGEANRCLLHYLQLVREFVFEEVRASSFPMLPSRYRCIWLIAQMPEAVRYWWKQMDARPKKLFEVQVTGKIHEASQRYLRVGTYSLNYWKGLAFKYWAGAREAESYEDEVLFEGFVKITREISPQEYGLEV